MKSEQDGLTNLKAGSMQRCVCGWEGVSPLAGSPGERRGEGRREGSPTLCQ